VTYDPISLPMVSRESARNDQHNVLRNASPPPSFESLWHRKTDLRLELITVGGSCNAGLEWSTLCSTGYDPGNGQRVRESEGLSIRHSMDSYAIANSCWW